ncbi:MAG: tetratricopeptide repeat protein [Kiritimatiellae bacterium]|nr:tetratricopeptide repeat protein [Kiritimatiellia bacterium]
MALGCAAMPLLFAGRVLAQEAADEADAEFQQELRYIQLLHGMNMPDIAEEVIAELKRRFPAKVAELRVKELEGMLRQGKFDEAQKEIDAVKDKNSVEYWAMVLAKGDAYYAFSRYPEADKVYLDFFKKVDKPSPALQTFYRDSAYRYAQMLRYLGKDRQALEALGRMMKVPLEKAAKRNVDSERAELMLKIADGMKPGDERKKLLADAGKLIDSLLWEQDIVFGQAIVMKAHLALMRGDVKGAQGMIETYMGPLKTIHDALKKEDPDGALGFLRQSPMPQCRYLLSKLLWDEVQAELKKKEPDENRIKDLLLGERDPATRKRKGNGAFNHSLNVFVRFPESQWAADAGELSETIRQFIKDRYNADIKTPVTPAQMQKVRQMQFMGARLLFSQNQFKEAISAYLTVLNQFPESEESVSALKDLVFSYAEDSLKDPDADLMADTVTGYLSERFSGNPQLKKSAGSAVREIAEHYGEQKRNDKQREVYALYFRDYPDHFAAAQQMMSFAEREFTAQSYPAALNYYKRIAEQYPGSQSYYDALSRMAQVYGEMGQKTNELAMLQTYVDKLGAKEHAGHALITAKFRLANAYREYGTSLLKAAATNETLEAEAKLEQQKNATAMLSRAAQAFGDVSTLLATDPKAYAQNEDERKKNAELSDTSIFTRAVCLTQINFPAEKVESLRQLAIKAFEEYVKRSPQGKFAPRALVQIGTLYTILKDAEKAQVAFDRLAKEYPDSDEAKNSVPMLAAALIDMGLRGEGVAKYRQMFAAGGTYTESQFHAAARALEGSREYELALQAYDKVLEMTKDLAAKANATLGRARCQIGLKRYADAHKTLAAFNAKGSDLGRLQQMVDANLLLVDVASEEGKTEKDNTLRTRLFNEAIDALKMVRNYSTPRDENGKALVETKWPPEARARDAELRLKSGQVLVRRMEAEKKLNLAERAGETRGQAIVAFMGLLMGLDPANDALRPIMEQTYATVIPLLLEHKKFEDAASYAEEYLERFPDGQHKTDVTSWLNQAKIGM